MRAITFLMWQLTSAKNFLNVSAKKIKKVPKLQQEFLHDQRTVRKICISGVDKRYFKGINKKRRKETTTGNTATVKIQSGISS